MFFLRRFTRPSRPHPNQQAFSDGFTAWDADRMRDALVAIVEEVGGTPCTPETRRELTWTCRETLENYLGHPQCSHVCNVPEWDASLVVGTRLRSAWSDEPGLNCCCLHLTPSGIAGSDLKQRWRSLGYSSDEIQIPRERVRAPLPLKGEPGYGEGPSLPSIHRAERTGTPPEQTYAHALSVLGPATGPLFERYQRGDRAAVWAELVAMGPNVRRSDVLSDAVAVARETMRRARANLETIHARLLSSGYVFEKPESALTRPAADVLERIAEVEAEVGPLPLSLCAWYEVVGSVNFIGTHPEWDEDEYSDPLYVQPPEYDDEEWARGEYFVRIAPDYYHKADVSGGEAYSIVLPDAAADSPLKYEWHGTTFVDYLRICFRWGGFPGFGLGGNTEPPEEVAALKAGLLDV